MPPQTTTPAGPIPLQGDALLTLLHNAVNQLFVEHHDARISHADRENAMAELLGQHQFAPQTLEELDCLHSAWMYAGQASMAVQALDTHREQVLQRLQGTEQLQAHSALALNAAQSLVTYDVPAARDALAQALTSMYQLDGEALAQPYERWVSLVPSCEAYDLADAAIDTLAPRLAFENAQDFAAMAQPWLDKTRMAQARGDDPAALAYATAAIDRFAQLHDGDVHPDFDEWAQLGEQLHTMAPACITHWAAASQAHLQRTEATAPSPAVQKHRAIYSARLQALACAQLGQRDQAIAWGRQGRYELSGFEGDHFVSLWMEWLNAAQLLDELAPIALESAFHSRPASLQVAWKIARARLDSDAPRRATWALILAWCSMDRECREALGQSQSFDQGTPTPVPPPALPAEHYLEMVLQLQPQDPLVDLMRGMQLAYTRKQWPQALPLLERGCSAHPWLCNSEVVLMLWAARLHVHGAAALDMPMVAAPSGTWCYAVGVSLKNDHHMKPYMGGKKNLPPQEQRLPLAQRYYEAGLQHFEQFWATGEGGFKDADIHTYSMLCNNLAIRLRKQEDYARAIQLHERGLASSPFAEHLSGLLWCHIMPDEYAGIARTAEQLWHFAREHGYGRHAPCDYFNWAAEALYHLDRDAEISIWLERLDVWWQEEGDDEDREAQADYLECLLIMLEFFAYMHAELVTPRLPHLMQQVQTFPNLVLQRRMGTLLMVCQQHAQALPFLQQAVQLAATDSNNSYDVERVHQDLQNCQDALAAPAPDSGKPWWKLW